MIKRFTFLEPGQADPWTAQVKSHPPLRAVLCTVIDDIVVAHHEPGSRHVAVGIEWLADEGVGADDGVGVGDEVAGSEGVEVVAREHVLRGEEWLADRWRRGGPRVKHMALARRADGLTVVEFQHRWRHHAGTAGGTPIPDIAKGQAYAQNHPVPGDWPYDAVNEVWFDRLDDLRSRVAWFADNPAANDIFGANWFLSVTEEILVT